MRSGVLAGRCWRCRGVAEGPGSKPCPPPLTIPVPDAPWCSLRYTYIHSFGNSFVLSKRTQPTPSYFYDHHRFCYLLQPPVAHPPAGILPFLDVESIKDTGFRLARLTREDCSFMGPNCVVAKVRQTVKKDVKKQSHTGKVGRMDQANSTHKEIAHKGQVGTDKTIRA